MPPPVQNVIHVRASRAQVVRILNRLPGLIAGSPGAAGGFVRALQVRIGLAVLQRVKDAFVVKARGGTDEAGEKWKKLSPHTVAYGRRHPGIPKRRPFWTTHPSYLLTDKRRDRWWELYRRFKAKFGGNKSLAAATAWTVLRTEQAGIQTIMGKYGNTPVEILRDSGVLLNSLSPGVTADAAPMSPPKKPQQVFRCLPGEVIIGTNRKGADKHHKGQPPRFPQRRLWPDPSRWPQSWWNDAVGQLRQGVIAVVLYLLKGRL
jgi:hypothetical protein